MCNRIAQFLWRLVAFGYPLDNALRKYVNYLVYASYHAAKTVGMQLNDMRVEVCCYSFVISGFISIHIQVLICNTI